MNRFHPAYQYKTWMRDGMFAAMIFDAAGYHDEARAFFEWAATCYLREFLQGFYTCYVRSVLWPIVEIVCTQPICLLQPWLQQSYWTGEPVPFVDPQFDSAGAFLLGVYHHYRVSRPTAISYFAQVSQCPSPCHPSS